jgi:putative flippase GtrA
MHKAVLLHSRQFGLFVTGGALSALVDVGLMQLLLVAGVHYALATSAGYLAAFQLNYAFHSRLTFAVGPTPPRTGRYLCVVALNYLLTLACVALAQPVLGNPLAGKLISLPLVTLTGYLLGKYWIFT